MERCDKMIPLSVPNFEGKEREYVNDAVEQDGFLLQESM